MLRQRQKSLLAEALEEAKTPDWSDVRMIDGLRRGVELHRRRVLLWCLAIVVSVFLLVCGSLGLVAIIR